jgi:hypothetical protein
MQEPPWGVVRCSECKRQDDLLRSLHRNSPEGQEEARRARELNKKIWSFIISLFSFVVFVGLLIFLISKLAVAFSDIAFLKIILGVIFFFIAILFLPYYLLKFRSKVKIWTLIAAVSLFFILLKAGAYLTSLGIQEMNNKNAIREKKKSETEALQSNTKVDANVSKNIPYTTSRNSQISSDTQQSRFVVVNISDGDFLNVREQPNSSGKILGKLPRGATVTSSGQKERKGSDTWIYISSTAGDGWVNFRFLKNI